MIKYYVNDYGKFAIDTDFKGIEVKMTRFPDLWDWREVKRRALVTVGLKAVTAPCDNWKEEILKARHSPIRDIRFSFDITCPYWVSTHLVRHVHAQPYVRSQRNDRQSEYDRNAARQDAPVQMIWDMNADELLTIAQKRLCLMASPETRAVVRLMCELVKQQCPEFSNVLKPACEWQGGVCHEYKGGCGRWKKNVNG